MLYWIWFAIFIFIGVTLSYSEGAQEGGGDISETLTKQFLSVIALFAALFVSWPVLGLHIFEWLVASLPQANTGINQITVGALMIVFCLVPVVGIASASALLGIKRGEALKANRQAPKQKMQTDKEIHACDAN